MSNRRKGCLTSQSADRSGAYAALSSACHSAVDPAPFVKNCEYDLCSCRAELADCYCVHLADYAAACSEHGVHIPWRAEVGLCGELPTPSQDADHTVPRTPVASQVQARLFTLNPLKSGTTFH